MFLNLMMKLLCTAVVFVGCTDGTTSYSQSNNRELMQRSATMVSMQKWLHDTLRTAKTLTANSEQACSGGGSVSYTHNADAVTLSYQECKETYLHSDGSIIEHTKNGMLVFDYSDTNVTARFAADFNHTLSNHIDQCKKRTHPASRDVLIRPPMTFSFGHQKRC